MKPPEQALLIFIKNPVRGRVKTRLARTLGDDAALEIYRQLTQITRHAAENLDGTTAYLFYSDFVDLQDEWPNDRFEKHLQTGGDLGERMLAAFDFVLQKHPLACIVGSDCPTLTGDVLRAAFEKLGTADFVIGPATDGGYYLLGMRGQAAPPGFLFQNMVWSTENVLSETLDRLRQRQQTISFLPEMSDVDEEKDWFEFSKKARPGPAMP